MLVVHDVADHSTRVVAVGRLGLEIIESCGWANETRLVCTVVGIAPLPESPQIRIGSRIVQPSLSPPNAFGGTATPTQSAASPISRDGEAAPTALNKAPDQLSGSAIAPPVRLPGATITLPDQENRGYIVAQLVAVNSDGSNPVQLFSIWLNRQPAVIDWLVDDPSHVLMSAHWSGVEKVDVYTGERETVQARGSLPARWIADGRGRLRAVARWRDASEEDWFIDVGGEWPRLWRRSYRDLDQAFEPVGFADNDAELLVIDWHEGRQALFAVDLAKHDSRRLVFDHPKFDVQFAREVGPRRSIGYVTYDYGRGQHLLNDQARGTREELAAHFSGSDVFVIDSDAADKRYVALVKGSGETATYYHYDSIERVVTPLTQALSLGTDVELETRSIRYRAADGAEVPGFLTLPADGGKQRAAVVLPIGDIAPSGVPGFDMLAQFLAANGYVVLRSAHRGTDGYGRGWLGQGPYQDWQLAVDDLAEGAKWLYDSGVADPTRICVVGWGDGAYHSLMAAARHSALFRCAAAIYPPAGAVAPTRLDERFGKGPGGDGRPVRRARDIAVPVLLAYAQGANIVPNTPFADFAEALRDADQRHSIVEYAVENDRLVNPPAYRVDGMRRLASFLNEHIGP